MDTTLLLAVALCVIVVVAAVVILARMAAQARVAGGTDAALRDLATRLEVLREHGVDLERDLKQDLAIARGEHASAAQTLRAEVGDRLTQFTQVTQQQSAASTSAQAAQLTAFGERLAQLTQALQGQLAGAATAQAAELKAFGERLAQLTQASEQRLDAMRQTLEQRLDLLRTENTRKLDEMRQTVDEKLQTTLEQRLGQSFKLVSDRLEQVHRGLGEMQNLAIGVGDLKRVLTNVKTRGTWGEVQLAALIGEVLTPAQYATNVETVPGSNQRVEFAIRLPGRNEGGPPCWLPVDAKFPLDEWQRLQDALERADVPAADAARRALADFLKAQAKTIRDAYVEPPHTTDFAILFVPTEGLYAEMMSRPGFAEQLQRDYRVTLAGPTNFLALLNSLQMGFRTLAIEKRSTEVWRVLGAVKTEFLKFGDILAKTKKKLDEASSTIDDAGRKSTTIARKLRDVEALPEGEADRLLTGEAPGALLDGEIGDDAGAAAGLAADPVPRP